jgi:hypothetical protein
MDEVSHDYPGGPVHAAARLRGCTNAARSANKKFTSVHLIDRSPL